MKSIFVFLAALMLVLLPTAANAHEREGYHGEDHGWVNASHTRMGIQDRECDGNTAVIMVRRYNPVGETYITHIMRDQNGCEAGGSQGDISISNPEEFRVCEQKPDRYACSAYLPL